MRNYFGKNGCYDLEDTSDSVTLSVYLNSPLIYESNDTGEFVRMNSTNKEMADIEFSLGFNEEENNYFTNEMNVVTFNAAGVNEFIAALMVSNEAMETKDGLIKAIEKLLNQDNAIWGIEPEDED